MRNILKLLLIICFVFSTPSNGQCPVSAFSLPDTACSDVSLNFQNNSIGSNLVYKWDFNANDLSMLPTGGSLGLFPGMINSSLGIDIISSNGNFFGFSMSLNGILSRIEFGNSITNQPQVTALGNIGNLSDPVDISLIEEGGSYYALVHTFQGRIYRLNFGNSLLNTPTATQLNINQSLFGYAYYHTVYRTGLGLYMLIANYNGGTITVIEFGNSILNNNPVAGNISTPGSNPISIAVGHDCSGYYGFIGYASSPTISRIEFGTSISASPNQIVSLNTTGQSSYRDINLVNDGYNWTLFAAGFNGNIVQKYSFGTSLGNLTPSVSGLPGLNVFSSGCYAFCIKNINSTIGGLVTNYNTGELSRFVFPQSNTGAPPNDSAFSPSVSFNGSGYYHISLTATDTISGEYAQFRDSVYIAANPSADFSYTALCTGYPVDFTNLSTSSQGNIISQSWTFGNGDTSTASNAQYTFQVAGTYSVSLEIATNYGCSDLLTQQLEVSTPPDAMFNFDNNQCMGVPVQLSDLSTSTGDSITSWSWDFGNGQTSSLQNPIYSWTVDGLFNILLVVTNNGGCRDTAMSVIDILPGPIVDFATKRTCLGDTASFINITTVPSSLAAQFFWSFGDGNTSSSVNPAHQYATSTPGDYDVGLIVTGGNNCNDTLFKTIHIGAPANTDFSVSNDSVCVMTPVTLNNASLIPLGEFEVANYWDFGNGEGDTSAISTQTIYTSPGTFTISLTIETSTSCLAEIQKQIYVIEAPSASFFAGDTCFGLPISFIDNSTTPQGTTITSWTWDFGDSTNSVLQNPLHQYSSPDSFPVNLTISHSLGCVDSLSMYVTTHEKPSADFLSSQPCTNQDIVFTDSSIVGNGTITTWNWDFGDGTTNISSPTPTHQYSLAAAYPVSLIVGSNHGCADTVSRLIAIEQSPVYQITSNPTCFGSPTSYNVVFTNSPPVNPGYLWDFGDSTSSAQPLPAHFYQQPGTYTTVLTISNLDNGCSYTQTAASIINENPVASFTVQNVCTGYPFIPVDSSYVNNGIITEWQWDAGVYGTFTGSNIQFMTNTADTFPLKLVVTNDKGCRDSLTQTLVSYTLPTVSFNPDALYGSPPLTVNFSNNSSPGTYLWDFGNGSVVTGVENPSQIFSDTGLFNVTLTVTTDLGCTDSGSLDIAVLTPVYDLFIKEATYYLDNEQWMMKLQIQNLGNTLVKSTEVLINLENQLPVIEYNTDLNLAPGQTSFVILNTRFPSTESKTPNRFCAEILKVNDEADIYFENNRKCVGLSSDFSIYPVYPNPGNGLYNIPIGSKTSREIIVSLLNVSGQTIDETRTIECQEGLRTYQLSLSDYPAGIYILSLTAGNDTKKVRLVKY